MNDSPRVLFVDVWQQPQIYTAFEAVHTSYFYPGKLFLDAPGLMLYWHGNEVKFRGFSSGGK